MVADDHTMLGRLLSIIDVCLESARPVSLSELADGSGLPKATAWRIAQSLVERRLLQRTDEGYSGGVALASMGTRVVEQTRLRTAAIPHLVELHGRTRAAVWVVDIRSNTEWPTIGSVYGGAGATQYTDNWDHNPNQPAVLASALGILALAQTPARAEELMRRSVPRLTRNTEVEPHRIDAALRLARESGEVVERERFVLGWSCLTLPIVDPATGQMTAVLGVVDRTPRFDTGRLLRTARSTADALSSGLRLPPPR
jgi:DNA-binding IclR family transcriptional regulator